MLNFKAFLLSGFILLLSIPTKAQQPSCVLSVRHVEKINKTPNQVKKLKAYRRFFRKDSLRHERRMIRYWKDQNDSMTDAMEQRRKALAMKNSKVNDGINTRIYNTVYKPWATRQADRNLQMLDKSGFKMSAASRSMLRSYLVTYFLKASQNDSAIFALTQQVPDLPLPKQLSSKMNNYRAIHAGELREASNNKLRGLKNSGPLKSFQEQRRQYTGGLEKYSQAGEILSDQEAQKDFLKKEGMELANEHIGDLEGSTRLNLVKGQLREAEKLKGMPDDYKGKLEHLQDSAYLRDQAKKKAEELAIQYVSDHPEVMQGVQRKMSLLMRKYSVVPNSNDLSTAVKRTSLKGRTFFEHLQVAANFQVISLDPFSIDFSPQIGYKINSRWVVGAGGLYRKTFTDSIPSVAADVIGYKGYSSYEVLGNFFVTGEYSRNSPGVLISEGKSKRQWENTLLAGVGRKFLIHPKVEMTLMAGYNFLHSNSDTIYPRPWVIRVGFQSSDLAFLNKKRIQAGNLR